MAKNIQSIRGMNDYLPDDTVILTSIEKTFQEILATYGYMPIRLPVVEKTSLFKRAIGVETEVIAKEMYSFKDRSEESLSLRPEGTAGCIRLGIQNGILHNKKQRLWYVGPMFRYERPQKGRHRQFYQLGAEVFGIKGPEAEA